MGKKKVWYDPRTWGNKKEKKPKIPISTPSKGKVSVKSKNITYTWGLLDNPLSWNQTQILNLQEKLYGWGYLTKANIKNLGVGTYDKITRDAYYNYLNKRVGMTNKGYSREEAKRVAELPFYQSVKGGGGGGGGYSLGDAIAREKQQRAHPYLNASFLADLEMTYRKALDREITASEKKFLLGKYVNEGWDIGNVQNYLAQSPEFKMREIKIKVQTLGDELAGMWKTITGVSPTQANIGWAIHQSDKEMWGVEKFNNFLRSLPTFRLRYPDIPDTMGVEEYDNFMRRANAISLSYGKGPITPPGLKQLLQGNLPISPSTKPLIKLPAKTTESPIVYRAAQSPEEEI